MSQPLVRLRVPFTVSRQDVDAVERGAQDADWQPVKDAAKKIAFAEDRAVFEGYPAAGITGIRQSTSNPALPLPAEVRDYPNAVSQAVSSLRLAGVGGPFSLLLSADAYTMVSETSDHGYPIREHLARVIDGEIIWAPAIDGAFLLSARGGDFELRLGQDLSIGYLSHDAATVQLYFQESLTFLVYTAEASVALTPGARRLTAGHSYRVGGNGWCSLMCPSSPSSSWRRNSARSSCQSSFWVMSSGCGGVSVAGGTSSGS